MKISGNNDDIAHDLWESHFYILQIWYTDCSWQVGYWQTADK